MPSVPDWYALVQLRAGSFQNFPELDCRKVASYTSCIFLPCSCNQLYNFHFFLKVDSSINGGSPSKIPRVFSRAEDQTLEGKEAKDLVGSQARNKARMAKVVGESGSKGFLLLETIGGLGLLGCSTISWNWLEFLVFFFSVPFCKAVDIRKKSISKD